MAVLFLIDAFLHGKCTFVLLPGVMRLVKALQLPAHLCQFRLQQRVVAMSLALGLGPSSVTTSSLPGDGGPLVATHGRKIA